MRSALYGDRIAGIQFCQETLLPVLALKIAAIFSDDPNLRPSIRGLKHHPHIRRLARIETWAERVGLDANAVACHRIAREISDHP